MKKLLSLVENRFDLAVIADWIEPGAHVLDLGCGNGTLLDYLIREKDVCGMGFEISLERITECIAKGIPVVEQDLNKPFHNVRDRSFDYVILSQTVQEVLHPDWVVEEMLRVGRYGVLSFPNFGNWRLRMQLQLRGRMPKTRALPYEWYDTPNIHMMTFADFQDFCRNRGIRILKTIYLVGNQISSRLVFPNLLSQGCIVLVTR
jgi:methionine biosynthesis protein MetW